MTRICPALTASDSSGRTAPGRSISCKSCDQLLQGSPRATRQMFISADTATTCIEIMTLYINTQWRSQDFATGGGGGGSEGVKLPTGGWCGKV